METIPFIHVPGPQGTITAFIEGRPHLVEKSHQHFDAILDKLMNKDYDDLMDLIATPEAKLQATLADAGVQGEELVVRHGEAFYMGVPLDNELGRMLVHQAENNYSIPGFLNFAKKLLQNPSRTAVDELYLFLRKAQMPICEDGDFLAYKRIRADLKDTYTGTIDNSPGQTVSMPRFAVDDNRNRTCSAGLHFCSYDYLSSFSGEVVVVLKINPMNVVSIPSDYDNTKGRACEYHVLSILEGWKEGPVLEGKDGNSFLPRPEADDDDDDIDDEDDDDFDDDDDCDW